MDVLLSSVRVPDFRACKQSLLLSRLSWPPHLLAKFTCPLHQPVRFNSYSFRSSLSVIKIQSLISACPDGTYLNLNHPHPRCQHWLECVVGDTYEVTPGTPTSNRVCAKTIHCNGHYYQSQAATYSSDNVCSPLTVCNHNTQYESAAPTETSNRFCSPLTTCDYDTQYQSALPTCSLSFPIQVESFNQSNFFDR